MALDITRGAADLHHCHLSITRSLYHAALDLVGNMRNDLHRAAEVVATALFAQHLVIDSAGREIVGPTHHSSCEPLVMPQIQIRLCPVVSHKHFAVLKRAHRAGVDVDVRVKFEEGHF